MRTDHFDSLVLEGPRPFPRAAQHSDLPWTYRLDQSIFCQSRGFFQCTWLALESLVQGQGFGADSISAGGKNTTLHHLAPRKYLT